MPEDRIDPLEHSMARIGALSKRLSDFLNSNAASHLIGNPNMPADTQAKLRAVLIPVAERISGQLGDLVHFLGRAVENAEGLPAAIEEYGRATGPVPKPAGEPVPGESVQPCKKSPRRQKKTQVG